MTANSRAAREKEHRMQRAIWQGAISFGLVHIPVHLFSAEDRDELDLTMLDKRDFAPVGYQRINKKTGREVEWADIVKAYEYEPGQYVVLSDEDLRRANVEATQTIDILSFVELAEIPLIEYERPYYLTPDKGGAKVYALLRETLRRAGKAAVAQIVLRTRQHLAAVVPLGDMLVLNTLRYADTIRPADEFEVPPAALKQAGISDKEVQMALSLVDGMSEAWNPTRYHDRYREDVLALVQEKIKTHQTHVITEPEAEQAPPGSAQIIDLMALLKESLRASSHGTAAPKSRATRTAATSAKARGRTARAGSAPSRAKSTPRHRAKA
jgi:DNA end-binding protein Ku